MTTPSTSRGRLFGVVVLLASFGAWSSHADEHTSSLPAGWELFEARELRFRIWLPTEAVRTENVRGTWVGKVREFEFKGESAGAEFVVQVRNLPRATRWLVTRSYLFAEVKDGLLKNGQRPELSDDPIEWGGYPGRRIRYQDPERGDGSWVEDALIVLAGNRLYFVVVARSSTAAEQLPLDAFFRSFELW